MATPNISPGDPKLEALAKQCLDEVGYAWHDIMPVPRDPDNSMSGAIVVLNNSEGQSIRLITLTLPIDCPYMVYVTAHECGHWYNQDWNNSRPLYIKEFHAEHWALERMNKFDLLSEDLMEQSREYVRFHCINRDLEMDDFYGERTPYSWNWSILKWCGYKPRNGRPLDYWKEIWPKEYTDIMAYLNSP